MSILQIQLKSVLQVLTVLKALTQLSNALLVDLVIEMEFQAVLNALLPSSVLLVKMSLNAVLKVVRVL
jgi:hypothetical protein